MNPFPSFNELPQSEQAGMREFWLQEKERLRAADPLGYYRLEMPSGEHADSQVYEMHQSQAAQLNSEKVFGYLASARKREQRWSDWQERVAAEELRRAEEFERLKQQAAEAATKPLALPDSKMARELVAWRKSHVAEVSPPEARIIPPPGNSYGPDDALWVRTSHDGSGVIRMEGTETYVHD